ncbi:hypothetical protein N7468_004532 [Penicillium chermesinum]|uniref:laccase n=1 Tax=Penicillium chermesinum TaxID=63820 RepID=A0A9W9P8M4_9EURO|nr:uncharacterized protein N7468_004532 [Penicillium chermesinum]KAJ5239913.1 hypothetical protein N7468_004532 [Penicillium chermesinum]KAJ6166789.1 hypothetical protein N7470_002236 [Penicillium chermesinum]
MRLHTVLSWVYALGGNSVYHTMARDSSSGPPSKAQEMINTDYTTVVPDTGVTREYWLAIDELNLAPDGVSRPVMAVNGTIPGPTIYADWGDEVVIHVTNNLHHAENGTSIHWHGIRQNYTNQNDGVVSVTQCPSPPGSTFTYKWRAVQYGSTWYHSHIGLQAWEGVFGGVVINGPASANYDHDVGTVILSDWSHQTADELYTYAQTVGPVPMDNGLINGTNVWNNQGSRFQMKVQKNQSYRIRLVNAAIDTVFKFMIDNHTLTVISSDLVPIKPYTADFVTIAMGQRYDVIVTANQQRIADDFWIRSIPQTACSANNSRIDDIKGILHYNHRAGTPTTSAWDYVDGCIDETNLVPVVAKNVGTADFMTLEDVTLGSNADDLFRWELNSTTMLVSWEDPTLLQIHENTTSFPASSGVIELPQANEWFYLFINTSFVVTHPVHLHGHDFFILSQGPNPYNGTLNTKNPPRRDTALLEGQGHLLIAFQTDNPGAWLMHCHIGWHVEEGFALQFVERESEIEDVIDYKSLKSNCGSWRAYDTKFDIQQIDSGV